MWSAVKDPMDTPVTFDKDGLDLAFKYFISSTLTMRLAGIAQINSHITTFNDVCNSENMLEVEGIGQSLANWLTDNKIISHIFGPNLHVEVYIVCVYEVFVSFKNKCFDPSIAGFFRSSSKAILF